MRLGRIEGGIEYFTVGDREEMQCARCGSSVEAVTCPTCGGDGFVESDDWEDQMFDDYVEPCQVCNGRPATLHCISDPEWCESHPRPGCEGIKSTAMSAQAWSDYL